MSNRNQFVAGLVIGSLIGGLTGGLAGVLLGRRRRQDHSVDLAGWEADTDDQSPEEQSPEDRKLQGQRPENQDLGAQDSEDDANDTSESHLSLTLCSEDSHKVGSLLDGSHLEPGDGSATVPTGKRQQVTQRIAQLNQLLRETQT